MKYLILLFLFIGCSEEPKLELEKEETSLSYKGYTPGTCYQHVTSDALARISYIKIYSYRAYIYYIFVSDGSSLEIKETERPIENISFFYKFSDLYKIKIDCHKFKLKKNHVEEKIKLLERIKELESYHKRNPKKKKRKK